MICGVVLAAGGSTRLGRPKQLLDLDGRPLLQHVVTTAAAVLDEVVVVLGHAAGEIEAALTLPKGARVVINPDHGAGQSTSLRAGLAALNEATTAAVILLGDQPRLPADAIRRVVAVHEQTGAPIVRALWQGTPGHPVLIDRSIWGALSRIEGDVGARDVIASRPEMREVEMGGPIPVDVDTWEEYEEVRDAR